MPARMPPRRRRRRRPAWRPPGAAGRHERGGGSDQCGSPAERVSDHAVSSGWVGADVVFRFSPTEVRIAATAEPQAGGHERLLRPGYAIEPIWIVEATYAPDAAETRPAVRRSTWPISPSSRRRARSSRRAAISTCRPPCCSCVPRARPRRSRCSATTSTCGPGSGWSSGRSRRARGADGGAAGGLAGARWRRAASHDRARPPGRREPHDLAPRLGGEEPLSIDGGGRAADAPRARPGHDPSSARRCAPDDLGRQVQHDRDGRHVRARARRSRADRAAGLTLVASTTDRRPRRRRDSSAAWSAENAALVARWSVGRPRRSPRKASDESTSSGAKCLAANVDLPDPAAPMRTTRDGSGSVRRTSRAGRAPPCRLGRGRSSWALDGGGSVVGGSVGFGVLVGFAVASAWPSASGWAWASAWRWRGVGVTRRCSTTDGVRVAPAPAGGHRVEADRPDARRR